MDTPYNHNGSDTKLCDIPKTDSRDEGLLNSTMERPQASDGYVLEGILGDCHYQYTSHNVIFHDHAILALSHMPWVRIPGCSRLKTKPED